MDVEKKYLSWLFKSYYQDLYRYGMKLCLDEDLTKDCIQDIFAGFWKKKKAFGEVSNIKAYLLESLKRTIFKKLKKDKSVKEKLNPVHQDLVISYEDQLVKNETLEGRFEALKKAMAKLTARQKEVISLKYLEGLDNEEITQATRLKNKSVRNISSEATRVLKKHLAHLL